MKPPSSSLLMPWLSAAVLMLIAYGSLYPFNFTAAHFPGTLLDALGELTWARAGRGDHVSNVLLYVPFGFCLYLWMRTRLRRLTAAVITAMLGAALSLSIEIAQVYLPARVPSLLDLALNAGGTVLGVAAAAGWRVLSRLLPTPSRAEVVAPDAAASIVLLLFLAWRFAPFVPHLDLGKLKTALQPLFWPHVQASVVASYLVYWLIADQTLRPLVRERHHLEVLLLLIAGVLVGRLFIADQAFSPSELAALMLLLPMIVLLDRFTPSVRRTALLIAVLAVLAVPTLVRLNFAAPAGEFDFWPFLSWMEAGYPLDWPELFHQLFIFAALVWVIYRVGLPMRAAAVAAVVVVLALEILQLWSTESASLTAPAFATAVAYALYQVHMRTYRPAGLTSGGRRWRSE